MSGPDLTPRILNTLDMLTEQVAIARAENIVLKGICGLLVGEIAALDKNPQEKLESFKRIFSSRPEGGSKVLSSDPETAAQIQAAEQAMRQVREFILRMAAVRVIDLKG